MFWSVSVMVTTGFGEKTSPQNETELIVAIGIFLISSLFFGYVLYAMRLIFEDMAKLEKEYK